MMDTLKTARALASAGLPQMQADAVATAIAEAQLDGLADLATKADISRVEADISRLEQATKADISRLEQATKAEFADLRAEMRSENALIRREMVIQGRDLTIKMGTMFVVAVGVLLAAIRYVGVPHP
jgi:hypothetical protein